MAKPTQIREGAIAKIPTQEGDVVTVPDNSIATTKLQDLAVTNNKQALMPTLTVKGNNTAGAVSPADMTMDQFAVMFAAFLTPAGSLVSYAGQSAPTGWLIAGGQAVSRTTFPALFTAISTTYGVGDGSTTFNLPDLRGRAPVGKDDMNGTTANRITAGGSGVTGTTLGASGGAETHTLTQAQLASHTHTQDAHNHFQDSHNHSQNAHYHATKGINTYLANSAAALANEMYMRNNGSNITADFGYVAGQTATNNATTSVNQAGTATNQSTGSGTAHNNTQPLLILNYIIKI